MLVLPKRVDVVFEDFGIARYDGAVKMVVCLRVFLRFIRDTGIENRCNARF